MDIPESQNSRDARIEDLWRKLDPKGRGEIDINGLQRGLSKIDHPLRNAQGMLEDIVKAIDKNKDGVIQYEGM
jgi:solute carrier family 25 phosphate transporter 23/24/25/41